MLTVIYKCILDMIGFQSNLYKNLNCPKRLFIHLFIYLIIHFYQNYTFLKGHPRRQFFWKKLEFQYQKNFTFVWSIPILLLLSPFREDQMRRTNILKFHLYLCHLCYCISNYLSVLSKVKHCRFVSPACLPNTIPEVRAGKHCWITGFGRLSSGGSSPRVLMQASVPVVEQSSCRKAYGSSIHESMICAGLENGGIDSCQGDSGGPMVCEYKGKFYLHGATSWGHGCAAPGKYGVYARVKYNTIMSWILETMNRN